MNTLYRYIISGSTAVLTMLVILFILVEALSLEKVIASAIAFTLGSVVNYLLQYHYVYKCDGAHSGHSLRYILVTLGGLFINSLLFAQLLEFIDIYLLAQLITIAVVFVYSFTINTQFTFKEKVG